MTGFELEAAKALTSIVIKGAWEQGSKLLKTLDKKTQNLIFRASQQYVQKYSERHGKLKVLGMREPVALETVYTAVQFLDESAVPKFESIIWFEDVYRQTKERRLQLRSGSRKEGIEVANEKQFLMILGEPGSGKSTFLRKIGLETLKGRKEKFQHTCIPVFIELKAFDDDVVDIKELIIEEFRVCNFPYAEDSVIELLEKGSLLILLDALDEIPKKNINEVINQIQKLADRYNRNRFIASCRLAAYRSDLRRFTDVVMADFDDQQIEQFIINWFSSEEDKKAKTAQKCWEVLKQPENITAKELAHTPLLLTFLCLVYDHAQKFPDNRSILYDKALRILLEEWAAEKRIMRDEIYQGLNTKLEILLLAKIAYQNFELNQLFFSKREIVEEIRAFLEDNLNAPKHLDGESILSAITIQQGILVKRAEDVFSFSHLTLQEYLTAFYIDDQSQISNLITAHLIEQRWKEVFLLVAGLVRGGANELLLLMEKATQQYINTPKLKALLSWINQITTSSEQKTKSAAKRIAAVFLILTLDLARVLAVTPDRAFILAFDMALLQNPNLDTRAEIHAHVLALAHFFNLDLIHLVKHSHTLELANVLEAINVFEDINFNVLLARLKVLEIKAPSDEQPIEVRRAHRSRIMQTWFSSLRLNPELIHFSDEELKILRNYFYVYLLVIQCKQSAVRVSPETWKGIEERILQVFDD